MNHRILSIARAACAALLLVVGIGGCGGLPQVARTESHALADNGATPLGQVVRARLAAHPGLSGAWPLEDGVDAFGARVGLARVASRTLDVQYYIFHPDATGHAFLGELLAAADRGVRVRLLLDDIHTAKLERIVAAAASHPNIQVRLFNPFVHRRARWLDAVLDFRRVSRRMHNKSLTADNAATIVGGRNIGAEYFGVKQDLDFSDLDLFIVGPVVAQVSAQFDQYWNSLQAYPLAALVDIPRDAGGSLHALRGEIARQAEAQRLGPNRARPQWDDAGPCRRTPARILLGQRRRDRRPAEQGCAAAARQRTACGDPAGGPAPGGTARADPGIAVFRAA
jgi:putative cardiolipin synthase